MSLGTGIALALSAVVTWFALATVLGVVLGRVIRRRDEQHSSLGSRGVDWRGEGTSAATARTNRPRARDDSPGSAASRINW